MRGWSKNSVELNWRTWEIEKAHYTYINKTVIYGEHSYSEKTIVPYGMRESIGKRMGDKRGINTLPHHIKSALNLPDSLDKKDVKIEITDDGDKGFGEFYLVFCRKCHSNNGYLSAFKEKYKDMLPSDPKMCDIWENWDKIVLTVIRRPPLKWLIY